MVVLSSLLAVALLAFPTYLASGSTMVSDSCKSHSLDFILLAGDALTSKIEDDVVADLAKLGISVNTRLLAKPDYNAAMQKGDFHLCFTESWGPPYDPHGFATGWFAPNNEAHYPALFGLEPPMTNTTLENMVSTVLREERLVERRTQWSTILQEMHSQAISNPMWSRRMPAIWAQRLSGYRPGPQQFDYPMHTVDVLFGSKTVTVAPGAQTGLFITTGPMDPHSYRPNEFFISNWIYEGLVYYDHGADPIQPALAISWSSADLPNGGEEYTFKLRQNVVFHDGTPFNCDAVKMTFDHVLHPAVRSYHDWYHLPSVVTSWRCADAETFVVTISESYYPFLQELSLIRPLRILSPESYAEGPTTNKDTHNSCPVRFGTRTSGDGATAKCSSVRSSYGTGPWILDGALNRADGSIKELHFKRNPNYWGTQGNIERIHVIQYNTSGEVEVALLAGTLDMVVGGGVLTPNQFKTLRDMTEAGSPHTERFKSALGPPLMNTIIVMNAARAPTDDIELRRVIMHAVNKASIVEAELAGTSEVADSLFPKDAPYCDLDLTPRWDYDLEKAMLLNCPSTGGSSGGDDDDGPSVGLILGLVFGIGVPVLLVVAGLAFFFGKRSGYKDLDAEARAAPKSKAAADNTENMPPEKLGASA